MTEMYGLWGMEIPCTRCVYHAVYLAHENSKGQGRGRSRHQDHSRVV